MTRAVLEGWDRSKLSMLLCLAVAAGCFNDSPDGASAGVDSGNSAGETATGGGSSEGETQADATGHDGGSTGDHGTGGFTGGRLGYQWGQRDRNGRGVGGE